MSGNVTICVGTVGAGAWLSPDGGESWRRIGQGLSGEPASSASPCIRPSRTPSLPAPMTASTEAATAAVASSISTRR